MALSEDAIAIVAAQLTAAVVTAAKATLPMCHPAEDGVRGSRMFVEDMYLLLLDRVRNGEIGDHPATPPLQK